MFREYLPDSLGSTIGAGLSLALYFGIKAEKKIISSLSDAPELPIDTNLVSEVSKFTTGLEACLWGTVKAQDNPIHSVIRPEITGVIWRHTIKEHVVSQVFGFWINDERTLNVAAQDVPFTLENKGLSVEISNPSKLESIDLSIVGQKFSAATSSIGDFIWGWMKGVQPKGTQEIEEMLIEGTQVLGVGRLVIQNGQMFLNPSEDVPFLITTMDKKTLIDTLRSRHNMLQFITFISICGTTFYIARLFRRIYAQYCEYSRRKAERRTLELSRLRREHHEGEVPENLMCVICCGLRDVVLMPCQHVCVCGECSLKLSPRNCPVCRAAVDSIQPVFYS